MALKLDMIKPSRKEAEEAEKAISTPKALHSKMQCMVSWVKTHGENCQTVLASRGDQRKEYLEAWLVMSARMKAAKKLTKLAKANVHEEEQKQEWIWWAMEQMDINLGPVKGKSIRDANILKTRPCRVTGSMDEKLKEYRIPFDWETNLTRFLDEARIEATMEGAVGDIENLDSMREVCGEQAPSETHVKQEEKSPEQTKKEATDDLITNADGYLRRMQDFELTAKQISTKLIDVKFSTELQASFAKHLEKVKKAVKVLEKVAVVTSTEHLNMNEVAKLAEMMTSLKDDHAELLNWAMQFKAYEPKGKKPRRS